MSMKLVTGLMVSLPLLSGAAGVEGKQGSRLVTAEMRRNALENGKRFDWAAAQQKAAIDAAALWVARSDEDLWQLVTSQELPRACYIAAGILYEGKKDACPQCGQGIGYSGKMDFEGQTWKVACPNCGEAFPKNDFLAFYRTALDEHGFFRRERGDRSLLFNAEHPGPQDPLHRLYVDDGYGMVDEQGNKHHVIAYYNQWCQWAAIYRGLSDLARAYVLTSEPRYAHKAAVLLDRIADVYPDMDYLPLGQMGFQHSHGGTLRGRIQGNIWEAPSGEGLARCYDWIFDGLQGDEELVRFCTGYANGDVQALRLDNDIFEPDPDGLAKEIAAVAEQEPFRLISDHLGRYGQAYVQTEQPENGRALAKRIHERLAETERYERKQVQLQHIIH